MKALFLLLAIVIVAIIFRNAARNNYFICPNCKKRFKPSALKLAATIHVFDKHNLKCPYCGERHFTKQIREE
jgi:uncharacterized Zn-finger protein